MTFDFAIADIGFISNIAGGLGFVGLSVFLLVGGRSRAHGIILTLACAFNAIWCFAIAAGMLRGVAAATLIFAEIIRDAGWLLLIVSMLPKADSVIGRIVLRAPVYILPIGLGVFFLLRVGTRMWAGFGGDLFVFVSGMTIMSLWGLILLEQLFRNATLDQRWGFKYVCLAVGALFTYDFFMYSYSLLGQHIPQALWNTRGAVNALVVPLIAIAGSRNKSWALDVHLSRRAVFHTGALIGCGGYLLIMAIGGYFVRTLGGSWGGFLWVLFCTSAILALLILLLSGTFRARCKVFISKHFFSYKYDYREEWLGLTQRLNATSESSDPYQRSIMAVAHMLESPGGALWLLRDDAYVSVATWNMRDATRVLDSDAPLVSFLREHYWIVDIREYDRNPAVYGGLELPDWLRSIPRACLVIPLRHDRGLLGFMVLAVPRAQYRLTWEDLDLLKTIGRQVGSFVGQQESNLALAQARQFEAFNRMTTFLMHDLKNIVAKQSLVVQNAHKHKANPDFVDDMVLTVDSSVKRMKELLRQLQTPTTDEVSRRRVSVRRILQEVIDGLHPNQPVAQLHGNDDEAAVTVDPERFATILGHVIRNAQDAAGVHGRVDVRLFVDTAGVHIEVADDGAGMDQDFIREHLFQPFYTTKSSRGMGIGAFQAREFIRGAGGSVQVTSQPGQGTVFAIVLPPAHGRAAQARRVEQVEPIEHREIAT